jgi:hypothetical protein
MFSRRELFEYFSDRYTEAQVVKALQVLAKYDASIDPDSVMFQASITEQLEGAFDVGEKALDSSPSLSLFDAAEVAIEASEKRQLNLDPRIFNELIYIVAERAIARAVALHSFENAVFDSASTQLNAEQLEKIRDKNDRQIKAFQLIANDDERINKILEEYGVNSQQQTEEWITTYERVLEEDEDFDPEAYLTELNLVVGEPSAKKSLNKSQSRKLIKHLFCEARGVKSAG